jgi:hypothetical protein|tara:strand:- start:980 stop:1414 length:435 start_codon:yes stop_codon:yes gene_type:complete
MNTQEPTTKNNYLRTYISEPIMHAITTIKERLFWFNEQIGEWVASGWSKIKTYVSGVLFLDTTVYENHCWNCSADIKSVQRKHKFIEWVENKWLGNEKCTKGKCNYFICKECSKCLCEFEWIPYKEYINKKKTKWVPITVDLSQ